MFKVFLGAMGGVFIGALLVEILRRKSPGTVEKLEERARLAARRVGIPEECHSELDMEPVD
ncbi:MAG: hypothetical protein HY898_36550 [Deltaproteobacteria bacterium]|nr:hypothetical protein [Deltaproteobacteria bacterium]